MVLQYYYDLESHGLLFRTLRHGTVYRSDEPELWIKVVTDRRLESVQ